VIKDEHAKIISKVLFNSEIRKSKVEFLSSDDFTPNLLKTERESVW